MPNLIKKSWTVSTCYQRIRIIMYLEDGSAVEAPEVPWDVFGAYPEGRTWDQKAVDGIPEPMEGAHLAGVGAAHLQSPGVDGNIWDSWILEDLQIKFKYEFCV